jgi:hypothetical protein
MCPTSVHRSALVFSVGGVLEHMTGLIDLTGATVNYDASESTVHYEVGDGQDFHPDSRHRRREDWEFQPWSQIPYTPLDNLAWYGWNEFKKSLSAPAGVPQTKYLGWLLHGIGDATVPMHVTSTFGYGHRPYEDAVTQLQAPWVGRDTTYEKDVVRAGALLIRAYELRKYILQWRSDHPGREKDIPIRDLVTKLANDTYASATAELDIYRDDLSLPYINPLTQQSTIDAYKDKSSYMKAELDEAIAATIAVLTSIGETLQ